MEMICDGVFEGGGMRGIGHVGAIQELEKYGYRFRDVAGSSAGAIVASLMASGYTSAEMQEIMANVDFEKFKHRNNWFDFLRIGKLISVKQNFGIYSAELFEDWLRDLLAKRGVHTFADVKGLKITAADITGQRILVLPDDLTEFGINPNSFSVAAAVRMSMSIPIFYEPYRLTNRKTGRVHFIADGGIISNYPIWLLDDGNSQPKYPIFGFRFERDIDSSRTTPDFMTYLKQVVQTVLDDDDILQATIRGDRQRTVFIPTRVGNRSIASTDFNMTKAQINGMFANGQNAAREFLQTWDFQKWINEYRCEG